MKQKGVISFTWERNQNRVILRTNSKFRIEILAYRLSVDANIKEIYKVCRNVTKEEVKLLLVQLKFKGFGSN